MDYTAVDCEVYNLVKELYMFVHALLQRSVLKISLYWLISNANYWPLTLTFVQSVVSIHVYWMFT